MKFIILFLIIFLISACGGGGGGGGGETSNLTTDTNTNLVIAKPVVSSGIFPLGLIRANLLKSSSNTFSLSGIENGSVVTGSGTLTHGNLIASVFQGMSASQRTITLTGNIFINEKTTPINRFVTQWFDTKNEFLGEDGWDENIIINPSPIIPSMVRINDTGTFYTANRYSYATKNINGNKIVTYVVEADTGSTALLKIIGVERGTDNKITSTTAEHFRITTTGEYTRIKETLVDAVSTLTIIYANIN